MKRIIKRQPPTELIAWHKQKVEASKADAFDNWGYADVSADLRKAILTSLVAEQGHICCYTGLRISLTSSHIEHMKPQKHCTNHEDTDYRNLLAAYPQPNTPTACPYGAHARNHWYEAENFVDPLRPDVEQRFAYHINGKIKASNEADTAAKETIQKLKLDHEQLVQLREQAIEEAIIKPKLTKAQAERLRDAMDERNGSGQFQPFCFVIKQACIKYLKRFEKK